MFIAFSKFHEKVTIDRILKFIDKYDSLYKNRYCFCFQYLTNNNLAISHLVDQFLLLRLKIYYVLAFS